MFDEFDDTEIHLKDDDSSSDEDAPKEMGIGKVSHICFLEYNASFCFGYLFVTNN